MSARRAVVLLGLPALLAASRTAGAQGASAYHPVGAQPLPSVTREAVLPVRLPEGSEASPAHPSLRAAAGVGLGVVVGGYIGYFVSQVTTSDWMDLEATERSSLRRRYTVSGAAVGALSGVLLRPRANHDLREAREQMIAPRTGRLLLGRADLERSIATNAYEAIQLERPEWLKTRLRADTATDVRVDLSPVPRALVVYLGEERVGEADQLREVAIPEIRELRYYDSRDATRRWRISHPYGAIEIVPVEVAPAVVPAVVPAGSSPR